LSLRTVVADKGELSEERHVIQAALLCPIQGYEGKNYVEDVA
jgi:hypothetical protein